MDFGHAFALSLSLIALLSSATLAQPASAPAPTGPTNITAVLEKAGQYTMLIRLMKATQVADQMNQQLNNSAQGLTIFAPTDNAFSSLKPGTLNSLTDQQKVSLIQFHIIPSFISVPQFQTVTNPLRTQAGSGEDQFPLNVTTSGNQVNVSTGINDAPVANTVYTDGQLAVYQVDKVLLPIAIFRPAVPAPAPAPGGKAKKKKKEAGAPATDADATADDSATSGPAVGTAAAAVFAAFMLVVGQGL
ncbi:hypothetical protein AMTRI_Chr08g208790 [Amborella trichopoda]|uniref:FAS1 domain-containing protein n=1 Tax=Amborella trichopoda TaxID=13333 RepID=W1PBK7_AMBTC|nr:fasciclin-like arabinogalactan protein 11 [Amborella trichopoda]ERN05318.1 hypothetical protein AMTR_s00007p00166710 [Amborella trichopoda]|eukprot:XP_006843643.1 fasciclin-like arabinogalactan protein 11 [Amborella trichopoda]